jgi:ABC-type sugar transport system substrate-binding protein
MTTSHDLIFARGRAPMKVTLHSLLALVLVGLLLAACGSSTSGSSGGKKICFAYQDLETEFWVAGHTAIVKALKDKGIQVIERNAHQDPNVQLQQVRDCISQHVDGIIIIPQDGASAITIIGEANRAGIPIGVFNRPPAPGNPNPALVVVADNEAISEATVEFMAQQAMKLGHKMHPLIMVGDLGDPNAVARKKGFDTVIARYPNLFYKPVEVATKWDAPTALAGLQDAMQANPDVDFLFTSSDFLYPQIESVLKPLGKWKPIGDPNHVIMGGIDGDSRACNLMRTQYVDATGVQDLFYEANTLLAALLKAVDNHESKPNQVLIDKGFALTQATMSTRANDMWGCVLPPPKSGV